MGLYDALDPEEGKKELYTLYLNNPPISAEQSELPPYQQDRIKQW